MAQEDKVQIDPKTFSVRDLRKIWGLELKQEWLVDGLIPLGSLTMLSGESGSGKSSVALALASAVASGEPFLGRETVKRPVLIVDRENGLSIYTERFKRFDIKENDDLIFWGHFSQLDPQGPASAIIKRFAEEEKPLIIFDSFIAFHTGDEQDATATRHYTKLYQELTGRGATVICIHHTGKGENTKEYRGSSDIKASLDVGLVLVAKRPMLKMLKLKTFKCREGEIQEIMISLEGNKFVELDTEFVQPEDMDWKAVVQVIRENPGVNQSQIFKALPGISPNRIRKVLMAVELKGVVDVTKGLKNASFYTLAENTNGQ